MTAAPVQLDRPTVLPVDGENAVAVAIGLIGDEWTLYLMRTALQRGTSRYKDWLDRGSISNAVLAQRLSVLTARQVLQREVYAERPTRYAYLPTARGRELWTVLLSIWKWEKDFAGPDHEPLNPMRHTRCGSLFDPVLVCRDCGRAVGVHDLSGALGPSGEQHRTIPAAVTRRRPRGVGGTAFRTIPDTMAIIGNRWSCAMLGAAFLGAHRFGEFEDLMAAPPTVVADRLRTFQQTGILAPVQSKRRSDWQTYHLTERGRAFLPVLVTALDWAQRWYVAPDGPAVLLQHRDCGERFRPALACDVCQDRLELRDVAEVGLVGA